ncbi:MAG TPA: VWA domain-containing protein [Thermoanaerobaculia bacterium]|jgi:VWFA-related protein|nr:VWA domain-containing protein [Thermoanaerobaculia bacterium]
MSARFRLLPVLTLIASAATLAAKPPAVPPPPSFGETVEVNVVNVDVYVTDKNGNRVTDLKKGDFQVFEDGKPVEITNFAAIRDRRAETEAAPAPATSSTAPSAAPSAMQSSPEDVWNLVVLLDDFNLNPGSHARAVRQLREFLSRELTPMDRVMLVTLDPGLKIRLPFTSDRTAIARAIDEIERLEVHGAEIERERRQAFQDTMTIQEADILDPNLPPCAVNIAGPAHSYAAARRQEVRRSISAVTLMVNSLSGVPGRKAVLHVSDGLPLIPGQEIFQLLFEICGGNATSGLGHSAKTGPESQPKIGGFGRDVDTAQVFDAREIGPQAYQAASQAFLDAQSYDVSKELEALSAHANAQRVTLYTLQASGLQAPDASAAGLGPAERMFQFPSIGTVLRANDRDSLQLLADETGGRSILDTNDFLPDLGRMRQDFENYYSLGYTPAHAGDGREHRIEVKLKRPGVQLRYRQSYRDKPALEKAVDRTLTALFYGFEDNPLGIAVEIGEQTPGQSGAFNVPIRLRIPLFKLAILNHEAAGVFEGSLRLLVATRGEDGRSSPVRQVAVPLQIPRKQVLTAMGQFYVYNLTLQLPPGEQRVAVAVRDEIAATTSYLSRAVTVTTQAAIARP